MSLAGLLLPSAAITCIFVALFKQIEYVPVVQMVLKGIIPAMGGMMAVVVLNFALPSEYSLIERTTERDLIPMAQEMGLVLIPWSPLANGLLTGKYSREELTQSRERASGFAGTRKHLITGVGVINEKVWDIVDKVKRWRKKSRSLLPLSLLRG